MAHSNQDRADIQLKAGKFLTFQLDGGFYGLEILKIREIMGLITVTSVPRTPPHVKGVINLRGKVVPVIDLRLKFGMDEVPPTEETCIIVAHVGDKEIGILVDQVSEVLDIDAGQIEPPPEFGPQVDTEFILGMGKNGEKVTILLDIDRVLETEEVEEILAAT
ncbi:MAG: chemotaxis protein CheW [Candidatus Krumholzibacteriia bacterium]